MAMWTQSQTKAAPDPHYALFFRTILGEASDAEIEERYVALARTILDGPPARNTDA